MSYIMVDDRAGSANLVPLLPPDITKKVRLDSGDVAFFGFGPEGPYTYPIGIEYKTAQDALQCMQSGRLTGKQLIDMSPLYKRVYVLIEGEYREGSDSILEFKEWKSGKPVWRSYSKVSYRSFDNWLNSISEVGHVFMKRSIDRNESAAMVLNLYHFWAKDYEDHKSVFQFDKSNEPTMLIRPSDERVMAARIPSIGWQLSARVVELLPKPEDWVLASEEQWCQIKGIGKTKARHIMNFLRRTP